MRLGDIYALCRFCCQNCSKIYREKECKIKLCMYPRIPATHTQWRCQHCHPSPAAALHYGDAGEEQGTWGRARLGQAAGLVHFCLCCFRVMRPTAPCKPVRDVDGVSPKQNYFSHWGCCESLPVPSSTGVGVCLTLSEQAQDLGCC